MTQQLAAYSQHEKQADDIARDAVESRQGIQEFFASRFGLDSSGFRVQTGKAAAQTASSLKAKAFTVGRDIFFDEGRYAPGESEGQRLLAHELAHVVQQRDLQTAFIQREPDDDMGQFSSKYPKQKTNSGYSYEQYKENIGKNPYQPPIQAASEFKGTGPGGPGTGKPGTKIPMTIKIEDLKEILNPKHNPKLDALMDKYLNEVNLAFALGKLDTIESQAVYLAHAAGETGSFAELEEIGADQRKYAKQGFKGRGPIQVTGPENYGQTLAYLEKDAEMLKNSPKDEDKKLAKRAREAVKAIKADPGNANKPEYTFLFSAAFMQMAGGVRRSPDAGTKAPLFAGKNAEDSWANNSLDNQANLDAATEKLKKANAALAANKNDTTAQQDAKDAVRNIGDFSSRVNRGQIKAATFTKALEVLRRRNKQVP